MNAGDPEMQRIEELLAARALGCIEPEDERHLEQVLDARPEIARQLSELEETASLLSFTLAPSDPNPAVRRRVLATCGCQVEAWWNRLANLRWFPALATTSAVTASVLLAVFTTSNVFNSEIDTLENQVSSAVGSWEALEQECSALASFRGRRNPAAGPGSGRRRDRLPGVHRQSAPGDAVRLRTGRRGRARPCLQGVAKRRTRARPAPLAAPVRPRRPGARSWPCTRRRRSTATTTWSLPWSRRPRCPTSRWATRSSGPT